MDAYAAYLVDNVLSEEKTVTYRLLSRVLKVHVNTAKQMLYEFHRAQNAKRPGTVHATYLIYGVKKGNVHSQNGADEDVEMASSPPYADSISEVVPSVTLSLITEENLKDSLAEFEEVSSIHVYSVAPHPTRDMGLLADVSNEVLSLKTEEDKNLAPITNPYVRARQRKGPGLKVAAAASAPAVKQQAKAPALKSTAAASKQVKEEPKEEPSKAAEKSESAAKKPAPALKRNASSGIMQAFSKAKPKKEVKPEPAKPSAEDSPMQALSDDGEDDEEVEVFKSKPRSTAGSKTKKQREEELKRMMEEDDEEEEKEKSEKAESPEPEPVEEEPAAPEPVKEEKTEIVESSSNGRRRGKRKVMRKKQIMDDQGYLVTIQEPGWESFSEDEAPRPATKPKVAAPVAKGKKGVAKGQGSITSFFNKKT